MPYPEMLVAPMRQQLETVGFKSLMNASEVEGAMNSKQGTQLLVFNSVCGCAAGTCRPGVIDAVSTADKKPSELLNRICRTRNRCGCKSTRIYIAIPTFFSFNCIV
jgi:putative YphP/YqiW family bacilliredoxin